MIDLLKEKCLSRLIELNLNKNNLYTKRLEDEIKEIKSQDMVDYFLNYEGTHENDNNLLVPYLLGICDDFDINRNPEYDYGDTPDVDIDYLPEIRDYLKEDYVKEQFGSDKICNIVTYSTFGLKNTLQDVVRILGKDRKEIMAITKKFEKEDGKDLTWEQAIDIYDDFKVYVEKNPDVAEATKKIMSRIRNMGMHASGLIISNQPISDFVPLVMVKETANPCAAWSEGQSSTDLGQVGLVKFDFLSLEGNNRVALTGKYVKIAKNIDAICSEVGKISALPGQSNWSDLSYLNDPKALEMANKGDLKMIFQFDGSDGIRRLARKGGVTSFEDLVAYTSLYRPATLKAGLHDIYCKRKNNLEEYDIHPILLPIMETTYGVMVYQEQTLQVLNLVGKVPLKDCEIVRKAISKKKTEKIEEYGKQFVKNGVQILNWPEEKVKEMFDQIVLWSGYGFNKAHSTAYTYLSSRMLYLKANHPLEFYKSILSRAKTTGPKDYAKLKDYKNETEKHGFKVNRVDINKSKMEMVSEGNEIYWSLLKIKGIGEDVVNKIVSLQPFKNYEDFLNRFGTDARVNHPLIGLRVFDEDAIKLYCFFEYYKDQTKKVKQKYRRYETKINKFNVSLEKAINNNDQKLIDKYIAQIRKSQEKKEDAVPEDIKISMNDFIYDETSLGTVLGDSNKKDYQKKLDLINILKSKEKSEEEFYGFVWSHDIEKKKNYQGYTFENFVSEGISIGPVEVGITNVESKQGPKVTYYLVTVEDANGEKNKITVWGNDYERFSDCLVPGNYVRLLVKEPDEGFYNYNLAPMSRYKRVPKESDFRVISLE